MRNSSQDSKERAEARLQSSAEKLARLEGLADALPVLISYVDRDFRYRFNNAAYRRWFHVSKAALAGKHVREVLGEEAWHALKPHMAAALKGKHRSFEQSIPYKTWGVRNVQVNYVPHRESSRRVAGFYALIRDVTEEKKLGEDLKRSEARLARAQKTARIGSYELDFTPGAKSHWSGQALRLIGRQDSGLTPESYLREVIHPVDRDRVLQAERNALDTGAAYRMEYRIRRPNGAVRWMQSNAEPKRNGTGEFVGLSCTLLDITERKRLERSIAQVAETEQRRIARDLHDGLGQLLSGTMHLATGLAERLRGQNPSLRTDAARVVQLLEEALAKTRQLAHGLYPVRAELGGLNAALQELTQSAEELFRIQCRLRIVNLPAVRNQTAATHIYRIVQEAIQNAVRHGKCSKVSVFLGVRGTTAILSVRDDGMGIRKGLPQSSGMGLQIMRSRAGILGGVLSLASRPKHGTRVVCSFPKAVLINNTEATDERTF